MLRYELVPFKSSFSSLVRFLADVRPTNNDRMDDFPVVIAPASCGSHIAIGKLAIADLILLKGMEFSEVSYRSYMSFLRKLLQDLDHLLHRDCLGQPLLDKIFCSFVHT